MSGLKAVFQVYNTGKQKLRLTCTFISMDDRGLFKYQTKNANKFE
jgi:hypothetical protein